MTLDIILFGLLAFLTGYFLGRRRGRREGREEGGALAPLLLRERSCELGYCAICHSPAYRRTTT